ncbi:MAG: hypothetical protein IKT32_02250 [Clostridia bacterium]|nr:hypothetical protein [Clostridia bacterium]
MFKTQNFCHVASNNRNNVKAGLFVYRTTDSLDTVTASGYFNERIIDINLHDLIIHEKYDAADATKVERNLLCVTEKTLENIGTSVIKSKWEGDIEQYIEDTFVKKDGSSVMSAPLKFTSGSMRGAIGPYLNGLGFWKMDSEGNLTQIATMSDTQFVPATDGAMSLGSSTRKLNTVFAGKINNGADLTVPSPAQADTIALKSQVDDAANSGEQLYTTGVWYAKMYAATTVPTGSEYEGRNYADFSQVDADNNPIIVVYTYTSGAWATTATITPPKNHNGYMTITSKIWDIAEQAGQQGGLVLWAHNQGTFTPYPRIVSFDGANITNSTITTSTFQGSATLSGTSTVAMPASPSATQIVNKQYIDDHADPLKYTSNCIIEIPQDINLTLSSGTLTMKEGSKVYQPNGTTYTASSDESITAGSASDGKYFVITGNAAFVNIVRVDKSCSGATDSLAGTPNHLWYDTTNNIIKEYFSSDDPVFGTRAFPLAIITISGGIITSIDQVFNGFGYIGSTVFALPGVKYLRADGRNSDGTLKSILSEISSVKTVSASGTYSNLPIILGATGMALLFRTYDEKTNKIGSGEALAIAGKINVSSGVITSFTTKTAFHAVDYSDLDNIDYVVASQMPTAGNNYTWYRKYKSGWVEQGSSRSGKGAVTLPITMADEYYSVMLTVGTVSTLLSPHQYDLSAASKTTTGFEVVSASSPSSDVFWEVKGKAA